jgi:hypothetical protein
MTGICAQRTAGRDVKRPLDIDGGRRSRGKRAIR